MGVFLIVATQIVYHKRELKLLPKGQRRPALEGFQSAFWDL